MNNNRKRILFASSTIGDPIFSKRISMIKKYRYEVEVITFERGEHKGRIPDCKIDVLGVIEDGRYLKRMMHMLSILPNIRRYVKKNDIIYAAGVDMALIIHIAGYGLKKPVILEVADIRELQTKKSISGKIYRIIDGYVAEKCSLIVATAQGYIDEYYRKWLGVKSKAIIIENKLDIEKNKNVKVGQTKEQCVDSKKDIKNIKIRIGYFGVLRCKKTLDILYKLAEQYPKTIEIIIAGEPTRKIGYISGIKEEKNVKYLGTFKSPEDLEYLYDSVDMVWACYPFPEKDMWNWRWARTNRYYESCFYKKPMFVLKDSGDAEYVEKYNIGKIINDIECDKIIEDIMSIKIGDLGRWQENIKKIPEHVYLYNKEAKVLNDSMAAL